jgi:hypothetical protein
VPSYVSNDKKTHGQSIFVLQIATNVIQLKNWRALDTKLVCSSSKIGYIGNSTKSFSAILNSILNWYIGISDIIVLRS